MRRVSENVWDDMVSVISKRHALWSSTFDFYYKIKWFLKNESQISKDKGIELLSGTTVIENKTETKFGREFIDNHVAVEYYFCNDGETVMYGGSHPHFVLYQANSLANGFAIRPDMTNIFRTIRGFYANVFCDFQGTLPSEYAVEPIVEKCENVLETMHSNELRPKLYELAKSKGYEKSDLYGFNRTSQIVELPVYADVIAIREYLDEHLESGDEPLTKYVTDVYWDFLYNISRINIESVWYYCDNFRSITFPVKYDLSWDEEIHV